MPSPPLLDRVCGRRTSFVVAPVHVVALVALIILTACGANEASTASAPASAPRTETSSPARPDPNVRPSAGCSGTTRGTAHDQAPRAIDVDGTKRSYLVAAPSGNAPAPLIVLLHGMGSNGSDIGRVSDLPARGAAAGAVVVTPDAVGSPTMWRASGQGPDAAFVDTLITDVESRYCIDTSRVAIAGFSVGAVFAAAFGCTHQDRIAAIVTVEVDVPGPCTKPMPILAFHGTADPIVPYAPPDGKPALGGGSGTEANLANWAKLSNCAPTPQTTEIGSEVAKLEWPNCSDGSEVILYKIIGGQHDWPGKDPGTAVHPSTQQVSATNEAIEFVERHPLRP